MEPLAYFPICIHQLISWTTNPINCRPENNIFEFRWAQRPWTIQTRWKAFVNALLLSWARIIGGLNGRSTPNWGEKTALVSLFLRPVPCVSTVFVLPLNVVPWQWEIRKSTTVALRVAAGAFVVLVVVFIVLVVLYARAIAENRGRNSLHCNSPNEWQEKTATRQMSPADYTRKEDCHLFSRNWTAGITHASQIARKFRINK